MRPFISKVVKLIYRPACFDYMDRYLRRAEVVLDVGCGNHSPSILKEYYPECRYYGIDRRSDYNLDDSDFKCMESFYEGIAEKPCFRHPERSEGSLISSRFFGLRPQNDNILRLFQQSLI